MTLLEGEGAGYAASGPARPAYRPWWYSSGASWSRCRASSGSARTTAWSPAATRLTIRQTSQASVPSRTGTPYGPTRHRVGAANRSMPRVAKVRASSCCPWASRCTATWSARAMVGQLDEVRSRQNDTSGGASDTDVNDVAVNPTGGAPGAVTTLTVLAWWRSKPRNTSAPTGSVMTSARRRTAGPGRPGAG